MGKPSKSALYSWEEIPATSSVEDLLAFSPWRNAEVVSRKDLLGDPARVQALWKVTMGEAQKSYLEGPFRCLEEVQTRVGTFNVSLFPLPFLDVLFLMPIFVHAQSSPSHCPLTAVPPTRVSQALSNLLRPSNCKLVCKPPPILACSLKEQTAILGLHFNAFMRGFEVQL